MAAAAARNDRAPGRPGAAGVRLAALAAVLLLVAAMPVAGQGTEPGFAPGWNGEAASPPMLWRHYGGCMRAGLPDDNTSCAKVAAGHGCTTCGTWATLIEAVTAKKWPQGAGGGTVSLAGAGYSLVEIDAGWERRVQFNSTKNGRTNHDAHGNNLIDTTHYPDMAALVKYALARRVAVLCCCCSLCAGHARPADTALLLGEGGLACCLAPCCCASHHAASPVCLSIAVAPHAPANCSCDGCAGVQLTMATSTHAHPRTRTRAPARAPAHTSARTSAPRCWIAPRHGHDNGLRMGWSVNNGNSEVVCLDINTQGDVRNLVVRLQTSVAWRAVSGSYCHWMPLDARAQRRRGRPAPPVPVLRNRNLSDLGIALQRAPILPPRHRGRANTCRRRARRAALSFFLFLICFSCAPGLALLCVGPWLRQRAALRGRPLPQQHAVCLTRKGAAG